MAKAWGKKARIIRAMPNTPGAIGAGITGLYAAKGSTAADKKRATALLSALGETVWVAREELIDSVTAVSGSGPAYLFLMAEALTEAGYPTAEATLATLACRGGGPKFRKYGRYPVYHWGDALEWARSRLSRPVTSTSELDAAA